MYFSLIDRITHLEPGSSIRALKALSLAEEYLQDHFPRFPVMPGVLMLESMYQTGAWLTRASEDFAHSMVVLKEARNVRYGGFVQPGQTLTISAEIVKQDETTTSLKAQGELEGQVAVSARLVLERYNLSVRSSEPPELDEHIRRRLRENFRLLYTRQAPGSQVADGSPAK
jgi:3-hydroxyacyl-[acyl-carrier-protein] dehydratase